MSFVLFGRTCCLCSPRDLLPLHLVLNLFVLQVTLPVYLNFTRADLIFTVDFEIATKEDPRSFYERGVAVLCTE